MKKILTALLITFFLVGCLQFTTRPDLTQQIATSLTAKAFGQKMRGHFTWSPQIDSFLMMVESDGVTLKSGQMIANYVNTEVPALYQKEARMLLSGAGFEFNGNELISATKIDKALFLLAAASFKEGLFSK
ncbi:MAG: hypothetical protein M0Z43_02185 [Acidithiobacillus sp.]|nr:hypothetical protein [Acidithiobacillus sp.]